MPTAVKSNPPSYETILQSSPAVRYNEIYRKGTKHGSNTALRVVALRCARNFSNIVSSKDIYDRILIFKNISKMWLRKYKHFLNFRGLYLEYVNFDFKKIV